MPFPDPADDGVRLLCWRVRPASATSTLALLDCWDDELRHWVVAADWREASHINEALYLSQGEPVPVTAETFAVIGRPHVRVASDHWRYPVKGGGWLDGCAHEGCE